MPKPSLFFLKCSGIFLVLFMLFFPIVLLGQNEVDTLAKSVKSFDTIGALIGAGLAFVVAFLTAFFTTKNRIKKEVDKNIEETAAKYVNEFFSKRLHVDPKMVHKLFQEYEMEQKQIGQRRIYVVFAKEQDKKELIGYLQNRGFAKAIGHSIDKNIPELVTNDIIIFNNSNGDLSDEVIDAFAKKYLTDAALFYYGSRRFTGDSPMANFANSKATLVNRLKEHLLS